MNRLDHPKALKDRGATLDAWLRHDSLQEALERIQENVRSRPGDVRERCLLFQMACFMGDWDRALKQLQVCARIDPEREQTAQVMRGLIRSEALRAKVLAGENTPAYVIDPPPKWVAALLEALYATSRGDVELADAARKRALSEAPDSPGAIDGAPFAWISDSDTRLGPVCELVVAGGYRWCPFCELSSLRLHAPQGLLDLLWARAECALRDGTEFQAYIPVRYPGSENGTDAIRLARETTWREEGTTGIIGLGQKTWMTGGGDHALLDLREITFSA
ncbi:MAG: ImpE protein superfamily protein [Candidatus Accumulibacter sp.]|jgi:type VI secretion system protein ImpE|nr:ImpE protein superfamily protein [Accumulibacter sp.]